MKVKMKGEADKRKQDLIEANRSPEEVYKLTVGGRTFKLDGAVYESLQEDVQGVNEEMALLEVSLVSL